jgi:methyltransferase (TIGR00027 family)
MESNPLYRSGDWVASKLLPRKIQFAFRLRPVRMWLVKSSAPAGVYEWVIARTKYIDALFSRVPLEGYSQVLFIGAGFDSRGIRFQNELKGIKVFELDAVTTQSAKIGQYQKRGITVPPNVIFLSINFEKESIAHRIHQAGFCQGQKTLVVAEGVIQYLKPEAVYSTFETIGREALERVAY